jgi:hypothetical protein
VTLERQYEASGIIVRPVGVGLMFDAHISKMLVGGKAMKGTYSRAVHRSGVICAALLALATPWLTAQTMAENGRGSTTSNSAAEQVAPAQPTAMLPEGLPAQAPRVSFKNGQLTIDAPNSILKDVLNAICRQIGAQLDMAPAIADFRVAVHLSGPPPQVISALLYGSELNYMIVGVPETKDGVQTVLLWKKLPAGNSAQKLVADRVPAATQPWLATQAAEITQPPVATQSNSETAASLINTVGEAQAAIVLGSQGRDALAHPVPATKPPEQPEIACDDLGLPPNCHGSR